MATFPVLKGGAVAQYPAHRSIDYATRILRFVDGSEQRMRDQSGPLRRWIVPLERLDDDELAAVDAFLVAQQGALEEFTFPDPWDGTEYSHCSLDDDSAVLEYARNGYGRTALVVRQNRG